MFTSLSIATRNTLQRLFDTCIITEDKYGEIDNCLKKIVKAKDRYTAVSIKFNIPWCVTGIMHCTTCDCNFKVHLHNGDALNGRTTSIPVGYPKHGRPPFTWEQSAEDVFQFYRLHKWSDWSIAGILYNLEIIHRDEANKEMKMSKLWCFSNHCESEKNIAQQKCGAAILLRRMVEKQLIPVETSYNRRLSDLKILAKEIQFMPLKSLPKVLEFQRLLNMSGAYLREDGRAGIFTAGAYHAITNEYLHGDPKITA